MRHAASRIRSPRLVAGLFLALLGVVALGACGRTRVACVGDSITWGHELPRDRTYPAELQALLGWRYDVRNFGHGGATLLRSGDEPYWAQGERAASDAFAPDVVVILLGTNDTKPRNWSHGSELERDAAELVQHYRALGARVYVALPPPVYGANRFGIDPAVMDAEVVPRVRAVAEAACAPVIDVFSAMSGHREWFQDDVHPTAEGAQVLARTVRDALLAGAVGAGAGCEPPTGSAPRP